MPTFLSFYVDISLLLMEKIGHRDIEAYLSWARIERNNGVRALARKQAVIKSLYRYLLREDMISKDVTIKLDPINVNQKLPKALEPNQIADLTDVLQQRHNFTSRMKSWGVKLCLCSGDSKVAVGHKVGIWVTGLTNLPFS